MSSAEQQYSQIEKESLSCVFGVKRFHSYLFGSQFVLITDHKPLISLLHEHHAIPTSVSARIQRWALTLSMYNYRISFKPSGAHSNADVLSRLPLPSTVQDPPIPEETVLALSELSESPIAVDQVRTWTRRDPVLSKVLQFLWNGWPSHSEVVDPLMKPFVTRKLELSVQDNVILWGTRVVIPSPGRELLLQELHACHPGIARMKTLARMFVWWPGLDFDIEQFVQQCSICQSQQSVPPAVTIQPWKWPSVPWYRIHLDLAGPFLGQMFLILIDAHSKWLEVRQLSSITSASIISSLRLIFAQFGLPSVVVTDNGRNFNSEEFELFLHSNGIQHKFSSPYHPSSNGLAERAVQIFKREMKKITNGSLQERLTHVLFYNHITPQSTTGLSPAELLQNRRLRCRLDLIKPDIRARVIGQQSKQQSYSAKARDRQFDVGEAVYVKNFRSGSQSPWISGKIKCPVGNVAYNIISDDGRELNRHVDHIRKRLDTHPPLEVPSTESSSISHSLPLVSPPFVSPPPELPAELPPELPASDSVIPSFHSSETERSSVDEVTPTRYPIRQRGRPDRYTPSDFRGRNM